MREGEPRRTDGKSQRHIFVENHDESPSCLFLLKERTHKEQEPAELEEISLYRL